MILEHRDVGELLSNDFKLVTGLPMTSTARFSNKANIVSLRSLSDCIMKILKLVIAATSCTLKLLSTFLVQIVDLDKSSWLCREKQTACVIVINVLCIFECLERGKV